MSMASMSPGSPGWAGRTRTPHFTSACIFEHERGAAVPYGGLDHLRPIAVGGEIAAAQFRVGGERLNGNDIGVGQAAQQVGAGETDIGAAIDDRAGAVGDDGGVFVAGDDLTVHLGVGGGEAQFDWVEEGSWVEGDGGAAGEAEVSGDHGSPEAQRVRVADEAAEFALEFKLGAEF